MTDLAVPLRAKDTEPSSRDQVVLAGLLSLPTLFLIVLCLIPLFLLVQLSFAHREDGGLWRAGLELTQYRQLLDPQFLKVALFSFTLALTTAAISVALAFPVAYFISRMKRRAQITWLVGLLSTLSLSEVLIVFSFQVLLSGGGGLVKALVALGIMDSVHSLYPNFAAVMVCLVYLVLPYIILFLYPAMSQLDDDIPAAATTMGASPARAFLTVVAPMVKGPLLSAGLLVVIFTVGSYLTPLVLGRPQQWTVGILISNGAMTTGNLPLAAAQAVALVTLMAGLLGLVRLLTRAGSPAS
ncbi:ABC transporter permease [Phenylobacterium sp.]|uniref:ABC transporter permease n=1 Tax=Phenylobacterium sp. TaxID=1871053 RepID=UPI00286DCA19|nr:ABC transporter permease [Phenylobacterium sp.]